MRTPASSVIARLAAAWRRLDHFLHTVIVIAFFACAFYALYEFVVAQEEFGILTLAGLVGLFWILLAVFVMDVKGMDVADRVVDWFQPDTSDSEPNDRESGTPEHR